MQTQAVRTGDKKEENNDKMQVLGNIEDNGDENISSQLLGHFILVFLCAAIFTTLICLLDIDML